MHYRLQAGLRSGGGASPCEGLIQRLSQPDTAQPQQHQQQHNKEQICPSPAAMTRNYNNWQAELPIRWTRLYFSMPYLPSPPPSTNNAAQQFGRGKWHMQPHTGTALAAASQAVEGQHQSSGSSVPAHTAVRPREFVATGMGACRSKRHRD